MKKLRNKLIKKLGKKGFTLIELLAVIVVLAIVMILAIPNVTDALNNSKKSALTTYAKEMIRKAGEFVMENEINGTTTDYTVGRAYSIAQINMSANASFNGCIVVKKNASTNVYTYTVYAFYKDKSFCIQGKSDSVINGGGSGLITTGCSYSNATPNSSDSYKTCKLS